jgi:hypothetical protein
VPGFHLGGLGHQPGVDAVAAVTTNAGRLYRVVRARRGCCACAGQSGGQLRLERRDNTTSRDL